MKEDFNNCTGERDKYSCSTFAYCEKVWSLTSLKLKYPLELLFYNYKKNRQSRITVQM